MKKELLLIVAFVLVKVTAFADEVYFNSDCKECQEAASAYASFEMVSELSKAFYGAYSSANQNIHTAMYLRMEEDLRKYKCMRPADIDLFMKLLPTVTEYGLEYNSPLYSNQQLIRYIAISDKLEKVAKLKEEEEEKAKIEEQRIREEEERRKREEEERRKQEEQLREKKLFWKQCVSVVDSLREEEKRKEEEKDTLLEGMRKSYYYLGTKLIPYVDYSYMKMVKQKNKECVSDLNMMVKKYIEFGDRYPGSSMEYCNSDIQNDINMYLGQKRMLEDEYNKLERSMKNSRDEYIVKYSGKDDVVVKKTFVSLKEAEDFYRKKTSKKKVEIILYYIDCNGDYVLMKHEQKGVNQ